MIPRTPGTVRPRVVLMDRPGEGWVDLLTEQDLFITPDWIDVGPGEYGGGLLDMTVATVHDSSGVVAGAAAWMFDQSCSETLCRPDLLMPVEPARSSVLFPVVLAGGWYDSRVQGVVDRSTCELILSALEHWGRERGAGSICWSGVAVAEQTLAESLAGRGYRQSPLTPRWALEGPWRDLDDYLAQLPSRRRNSVRREIRQVAEAGISCHTRPLTLDDLGEAMPLVEQNVLRYDGQVDLARYQEWVGRLVGRTEVFPEIHVAERAGRMVGCVVTSRFRGRMYALFPGFDYQEIEEVPVYFVLAYYHLVTHASAHGLHAIEYGPEADDAKRRRGCTASDQSLWIKPLGPEAAVVIDEAAVS